MTVMPKGSRQFTSREFNQNTGEAKNAAKAAPVFITDRGKAAYVLLSIEEYENLLNRPMSLAEALEQKDAPDFDVEFPPMGDASFRELDLS